MHWQDLIFLVGNWVFVAAMIPTIRGNSKPALQTSLTTAVVLTTFVVCYLTLNLWLAAFSTALSAGTWYVLAYQKSRQK